MPLARSSFAAALAALGMVAATGSHAQLSQTYCARPAGGSATFVQAHLMTGSELKGTAAADRLAADGRYLVIPWAGLRMAVVKLLNVAGSAALSGTDLNGRHWEFTRSSACF